MNKKILFINHVFWPDKINTARLVAELAEDMVKHGWKVTALVTNRQYVDHRLKYAQKRETWHGVEIIRAYHPPLSQKKNLTRLITAFILQLVWLWHVTFLGRYNIILIGTNPPFSYFMLPFLKILKPQSKLVMWAHDLYPEAIMVTGGTVWNTMGRMIKPLASYCIKKNDVIVDIGSCMKSIYLKHNFKNLQITLPPWSFVEPEKIEKPDPATRKELFGNAKLAILYSGTFGNAHEYDNFLALARELRKRNASVAFCFGGFGNRFNDLKEAVMSEDTNISFTGFVETDDDLKKRLLSADFHLVSLKPEWTGISVPSKFFGSIASGKAVIFSGSKESAISKWITEFNIGFTLTKNNIVKVANALIDISNNKESINEMQKNAFHAYHKSGFFSKKHICDSFDKLFSDILK